MNNPRYTPSEAIKLISKELDILMTQEWDSSTLPDIVEWMAMIIDHTDLDKKKVGNRKPKPLK